MYRDLYIEAMFPRNMPNKTRENEYVRKWTLTKTKKSKKSKCVGNGSRRVKGS